MSPAKYDLGDYKEVSERIVDFRMKFPDGVLAAEVILWPTKDLPFIAVRALAYRSRKDETPAVGLAWEPFPGRTPYTKDSELQNAETSAWGRAIVAALASDTKHGIASADEIRARRETPESASRQASGPGGTAISSPPRSEAVPPSSSAGEDKGHPPVEASEGEPKNRGESGEGSSGEGSSSATLLDQARRLYADDKGQRVADARLIAAAKMLWEPVKDVKELDASQLQVLIEKKAPVSA